MSSKAHDHVHRLIRSMTRAEKRYFKLFTGRHVLEGQSNQQVLFDAIGAMDEYDEPALLARFEHEAFTNRFAITKRRLYEAILRSLGAFHAESSVDSRLNRLLHQVELLYRRALYDDAQRMLLSARKLAQQHERPFALLAVLQWERKLLEGANYANVGADDLQRIAEESGVLLSQQSEIDQLWDLKSRLLLGLYRQGQARNEHSLSEVRALLDHSLLADPDNLSTAKARFLFHHLHGAAAFATGDLIECHKHLTSNLAVLHAARECFLDEPNLVIGVMSNLIYVAVRLGRYEEAFAMLQEFRTLPTRWGMPETEDLDLKLFSTSASLELTIHSQLGDFDKALEMVPSVERGLAACAERMGPVRKAGFYYQLAYIHFGAGQNEKALRWINRLLNDVHIDESAEIICFGRMLNLLTLLEVGKKDLLPYELRNTERYLRTRLRSHRFEPLFLDMVRKVTRARTPQAAQPAYQDFHDALLSLEHDPMEHAVFDHLDPIAWVRSKLSGRSFAELVRERAARSDLAA
ncbi:MAG: hypothetical protein ABI432_09260 [Flavobacteriales bacterium]